jgi:hypothetical protein
MQKQRCGTSRVWTLFLVSLLISSTWLENCEAQDRTGAVTPPAGATLHIVVVQGDGAVNNVKQRVAREMIVQVQDDNNRPVAGAAVVFILPRSGPGGTFAHGSKVLNITTDAGGRATAPAFQPNKTIGSFQIQVTAAFQGQTGATTISGANALGGAASAGAAAGGNAAGGATAAGGGISGATIGLIVGGVAAATAAAIVIAKRSSTPTAQGTIGLGTGPVFAPPRPN